MRLIGTVIRPIAAAPMVGGIVPALITVLVVFPAVFVIWEGYHLRDGREDKDMTG